MYRNYKNLNDCRGENPEEMMKALEDLLRELVVTAFCLKLEMAEDEYSDEDKPPVLVMRIDPTGGMDICTAEEADELFDCGLSDEDTVVFDGQLILSYDYDSVADLGGTRYLLGPAVIREIDENGNDCSITEETIRNVFDFMEANLTGIEVDGMEFPAFRLVD